MAASGRDYSAVTVIMSDMTGGLCRICSQIARASSPDFDAELECAPADGQIGFWQLTAFWVFGKKTHGEAPHS
jgi:hypothetical protein